MRCLYRSLPLLALVFQVGASRGADPDPILKDLDKAKDEHKEAVAKARVALLAAFDQAIKAVAQTGNLDTVKGLRAERAAFEEAGKMPTSAKMAIAAGDYQRAARTARAALDKAYEQAVRDATKGLKIELAEAIRADWKAAKGDVVEAKEPARLDSPAPSGKPVAGTYAVRYTPNRTERTYVVKADGEVLSADGKAQGRLKPQGGAFLLDFGDRVERLTFADGRVFIEHFYPKADLARNWPDQVGIGEPVKKK